MVDLDKIKQLVDKYYSLEKEGRIKDYNEEMTKKDFIIPLFRALGWDTENSKEVSAEEAIKNKRVDYGFKIDGIPKFFLEAKSLKDEDIINLKYVQQAIDYAWMKSCRWAVLTNFRTLVIYNAEERNKDPRLNRFLIFSSPEDYLKDDKIYLLSKESFEKGELDKQAVEVGKAELKKPVDKALLDDITNFREILYNNIKKNNPDKKLNDEGIEEAVQRIIDRMIFIRSAEDRWLEPEELRSKIREWSNTNKGKLLEKLSDLYKEYDDNYNSKLFAHHPCDDLKIDDDVLNTVINGLYESKDGLYRYDFSLLSADILGNIYEQYLGRILKKVGKNSKLEASKTKRKSEGIYYTPTYIVDYIVKNTVGEYIKTHKEKDIDNIKILDPACGSGSFLLKAYDVLENYWKEKNKLEETKLEESGSYSKKVDIVTKNIFGVDLDEKAVEIAQLNLLLKIAEKRKRLPKLHENIKNGNSLIDDEKVSDKAFNWNEGFVDITKNGGFDIIVGNPPWVQSKFLNKDSKDYYDLNYSTARKQYDLFNIFIEKGLQLLKEGGVLGFIVPDRFITNLGYDIFRKFLLNNSKIKQIVQVGEGVFTDVEMPSAIIILEKCNSEKDRNKNMIRVHLNINSPAQKMRQIGFYGNEDFVFSIFNNNKFKDILKKIEKDSDKLSEFVINGRGVEIGKKSTTVSDKSGDVKFLIGSDIDRYEIKSYHYLKLRNSHINYKSPELYKGEKILVRKTGLGINAVLDENTYVIQVIYIFKAKNNNVNLRDILGILNSKLMNFYYFSKFGQKERKVFPHLTQGKLLQLPIKYTKENDKVLTDKVNNILSQYHELNKLTYNSDKKMELKKKIERTSEEIDNIIYKIYGITDEEKKIIEESLK